MRRTTKSALRWLGLWAAALSVILYFNGASPSKKAFAWTTIRYITSSSDLPKPRGICPGLQHTAKPALIVARVEADGNSHWLDPVDGKYHLCIYTADAPLNAASDHLQVPANRGHEAMAYLTFIIDNYAHIPKAGVVFVHGSRFAWHNDDPNYDNLASLLALNVKAALEPYGYHNLRCDWSAGTCDPDTTPQGSLETTIRSYLEPFNARVLSDKALPPALGSLFGPSKAASLGRGDAVRSQCCAQFVVSRERIWQHSRDEYVAIRQWLLDGSSKGNSSPPSASAAPKDDRIAGRILSYVWHILFMQHDELNSHSSLDAHGGINLQHLNELACPRADQCYCRLYGRCGLSGCSQGRCHGQYRLPPNYKLPSDWAATHS